MTQVLTDTDDVRIEKTFRPDGLDLPAVTYDIESTGEEPVQVGITEAIPANVPVDDVGFHADYDGDRWTGYRGGTLQYRRVLDPGETVTTAFFVRSRHGLDETQFEDTARVVTGALDPAGATDDDGDLVLLTPTDDAAAPPAEATEIEPTDDASDTPREGTETEPNRNDDPLAAYASAFDDPDLEDLLACVDETLEATDDSRAVLLPMLVAELADSDDVELAALRAALGVDTLDGVDARVRQVQSRVDDLEASVEALEGFVDVEGDGETIVDALEAEVQRVRAAAVTAGAAIEELERRSEALAASERELDARLADLETAMSGSAERAEVSALRGELDVLSGSLEGLEAGVGADVERLQATLEVVSDRQARLDSTLGDVRDALASVEDDGAAPEPPA